MSNHYDILGLKPGASSLEIKAAFRRLAKLFHPDKNPGGREHFNKILRAYEVLSDPILRSSYDYRMNRGAAQSSASRSKTTTKTWSFDEKEMKRRQYYNEHIRKYTKTNAHYAAPEARRPYNEYKYILFATPLAVALFLLIMRLASDPPDLPRQNTPGVSTDTADTATAIRTKTYSALRLGFGPGEATVSEPYRSL